MPCSLATHGFGWHFNLWAGNVFQRCVLIVKQFPEELYSDAVSHVPIGFHSVTIR